ncbi:hypothetical protein OG963_43430 (plasmid) [Streptomyces sp. NBC_01707]
MLETGDSARDLVGVIPPQTGALVETTDPAQHTAVDLGIPTTRGDR